MHAVSSFITAIFDIILRPFNGLPPVWGLLFISALTGIVMVVIFKYTSNQAAIRSTKEKIGAYFLEIRLFKDDLGLMLDAQKRILRTNLTYMKYSVIPMLVMMVPVVLILIQLAIRYDHRPLKPGESALVKLVFSTPIVGLPVSVDAGDGLRLETPLLHIPEQQEIDFRVGALEDGDHQLTILLDGRRITTPLSVSERVERTYVERTKAGFSSALFAAGQEPLPNDARIEAIRINLPRQHVNIFGFNVHWLLFFLVVSLIAGYSLKGVFRVEV